MDDLLSLLNDVAPGGRVASMLPAYEERPQQVEMMRAICEAFSARGTLIVEAGTGVGKSLAYLLPALEWAARSGERVVVSTNTINLQEQLLRKDIPLIRKAIDNNVGVAMLKGRSNYICPRRLEYLAGAGAELVPLGLEWQCVELAQWLETTSDGTRADLAFKPAMSLWEEVCSDRDRCQGGKCAFNENCFYQRSRRDAQSAGLVVVNHHLLMTDMAMNMHSDVEGLVIPQFTRLIIDEAHHLDSVARSHLGGSLNFNALRRMVDELRGAKGRSGRKGSVLKHLLTKLAGPLGASATESGRQLLSLNEKLVRSATSLLSAMDDTRAAISLLGSSGRDNALRCIVDSKLLNTRGWVEKLEPALRCLEDSLIKLASSIGRVLSSVSVYLDDEDTESVLQQSVAELARLRRRAEGAADFASMFINVDDQLHCRWFAAKKVPRNEDLSLTLQMRPFDVSTQLRNELFEKLEGTVLTSATLTVAGDFSYAKRSLGLVDGPVRALSLSSPFDFKKQGVIGIPTDVPPPSSNLFTKEIGPCLLQAIDATMGRTFILFTSYQMMNQVYDDIGDDIWDLGYTPMKQGEMSREHLIERFCEEDGGVLFGTSSFWEGVDVRGEALVSVIIVKLPFQVPTDPMVKARGDWLQKRGLNPFRDESLPKAVLSLKQGVGRLIRSKSDKGVILILDKRVVTKSYGRKFLASLPGMSIKKGPWRSVYAAMVQFVEDKLR